MMLGKFSSMNLRRKVRYLFLTAIVILVIFCFAVFSVILRNHMTSSAMEKGRNNLDSIAQNLETELDNVNNMSRLVMVNQRIRAFLKQEEPADKGNVKSVGKEINTIMNSFSGRYSVFVFRLDKSYIFTGVGICSVNKNVVFGEEWMKKITAKDGGFVLIAETAEAFVSNTKTKEFTFARAINDVDTQQPIGFLVMNIPISVLEDTYKNLSNEKNHFAYLDEDGDLLCNDENYSSIQQEYRKYGWNDTTTKVSQKISGNWFSRNVVSAVRVTNSNYILISNTGVDLFEGVTLEVLYCLIGVLLITILAMWLVNTYITKYITVPIQKLEASMTEVKNGWLHRVSAEVSNDEIGRLKNNYNDMLVEINHLIDELMEEEKNRQKAEMVALQEQIKPHFLYNTLDTIAVMALENKSESVYDAIETLGNFYRKFLSRGNRTISLKDEIAIVKDYMKLQRLRYDEVFVDEYDIDEELLAVKVPKLILQPLVENSIYHGVRLKGEQGIIRITALRRENFLILKVYDTGVGMRPITIAKLMHGDSPDSFGFQGTMNRIRYYCDYPDVYTIRSEEGEYCEIEVKLPLDLKEPTREKSLQEKEDGDA